MANLTCPLCQAALDVDTITRKETCPGCGHDLHACQCCRFFDRSAHNQCREPQAEWQAKRDRANFCGFFELAGPGAAQRGGDDPRETERQRQLDDLFKNFQ